jgi:hypothetical protein
LQDVGKKLVSAQHYNKDGSVNNSRCTSIAWVPGGDGSFVAAHADGNLYVYEKASADIEKEIDFSLPNFVKKIYLSNYYTCRIKKVQLILHFLL